jgi:hypothetical protein
MWRILSWYRNGWVSVSAHVMNYICTLVWQGVTRHVSAFPTVFKNENKKSSKYKMSIHKPILESTFVSLYWKLFMSNCSYLHIISIFHVCSSQLFSLRVTPLHIWQNDVAASMWSCHVRATHMKAQKL